MRISVTGSKHLLNALKEQWIENGFKYRDKRSFEDIHEPYWLRLYADDNFEIGNHAGLNQDKKKCSLPEDWDYLASLEPEKTKLKAGTYTKRMHEPKHIQRISSIEGNTIYYSTGGHDDLETIKIGIENGRYKILDNDEIRDYLIDKAQKLGFLHGKTIKPLRSDGNFHNTNDVIPSNQFIYKPEHDCLYTEDLKGFIYFKGKWAEVVNETQTIAGYVTETNSSDITKIGCFYVYNSTLEDLKDAINKHNVDIYVDGEKVNDDIKNLEL